MLPAGPVRSYPFQALTAIQWSRLRGGPPPHRPTEVESNHIPLAKKENIWRISNFKHLNVPNFCYKAAVAASSLSLSLKPRRSLPKSSRVSVLVIKRVKL
uniref:Uncharacterized protein n=1 Tax=Helianthus annuus TaxID=4232 RepID=A0A251T357_HELAN